MELSVDNIRYAVPVTAGKFEFGAGSISVDLRHVVLHEVGHWFGVPHVDTVAGGAYKDVMTSVPEDGKPCVSAASLIMLNNATDLRWKYRVLEGGGLRRPRQSAQQMQQLRGR